MTEEKFVAFWNKHTQEWYENVCIKINNETYDIKDLCTLRRNYEKKVYKMYEQIKRKTKECYFQKPNGSRINRYKRAAVIAYAINKLSPVIYNPSIPDIENKALFLNQRLAFYMAWVSIITDFPEEDVNKITLICDFAAIQKTSSPQEEDDFLISIYKDMYFSGIYRNYNVLTMANVFGLLTEHVSELKNLKPIEEQENN